ncbi:MAG: hypothetical protein RH982_13920 [Parvibaculum sp.]|uniref:hypothetical protein n=1 Tax=Parvibaculum sp. TaxID=2024848 RepID=UPI0032EB5313
MFDELFFFVVQVHGRLPFEEDYTTDAAPAKAAVSGCDELCGCDGSLHIQTFVMPGPDPGIQKPPQGGVMLRKNRWSSLRALFEESFRSETELTRLLDCRVKPGNDECGRNFYP